MVSQPMVRAVPVGEQGVMVIFPSQMDMRTLNHLQMVVRAIQVHGVWPITLQSTAYASALFRLRPEHASARAVADELTVWLSEWLEQNPLKESHVYETPRSVEIPVCYDPEFGLDLHEVAHQHNRTVNEVVQLHHQSVYQVAMIGFRPGFPYLLGLPQALATPRRAVPRIRVEKGSVAIGGSQTGIYPESSPGGWNVIGRTPIRLFQSEGQPMSRLRAFDTVRFIPISGGEFQGFRDDWSVITNRSTRNPGRRVQVLSPGLQTTIQDMGRTGYEDQGVSMGGVADWFSAAVANLLVGNSTTSAMLECTLTGPSLRFHQAALIALTGADMEADVDGCPLQMWTSVWVEAGSVLSLRGAQALCRTYLAVDGGFDVPLVLGSASTMLSQGIGGYHGRSLKTGDEIPLGEHVAEAHTKRGRALPVGWRMGIQSPIQVHFLPSQTSSAVSHSDISSVCSIAWRVDGKSDRMGLRLVGNDTKEFPASALGASLLSEPVVPGTIQLPPSGSPIVLLADAQTVGGYPTVGVVCMADLPHLAQAHPGSTVQFIPVDEGYARQAYRTKLLCLDWLARQTENRVTHLR